MAEGGRKGQLRSSGLRPGWTTGACSAAAAKAAWEALLTGAFPDAVDVTLPGGHRPTFTLTHESLSADRAEGAVVKAGQPIGELGSTGAARNMLHFEIRLNGKPVDPLLYLPKP